LKARGLVVAPQAAIGDGALGFWKALDESFPTTRHQRCWLHKTSKKIASMSECTQRKETPNEPKTTVSVEGQGGVVVRFRWLGAV
jgi:transposase-like protein